MNIASILDSGGAEARKSARHSGYLHKEFDR